MGLSAAFPSRTGQSVGRGHARWDDDRRVEVVAKAVWRYPKPFQGFEEIAGYITFYPAKVECRVAGERVRPQPGGFYAGW